MGSIPTMKGSHVDTQLSRFSFDGIPSDIFLEGVTVGRWNGFPVVRANAEAVVRFFDTLGDTGQRFSIVGGDLAWMDDGATDVDGVCDPCLFPIADDGTVTLDGMTWCEFAGATVCADALTALSPADRVTVADLADEIEWRLSGCGARPTGFDSAALVQQIAYESGACTVSGVVRAVLDELDAYRSND